jgi:beta-lactamase class D
MIFIYCCLALTNKIILRKSEIVYFFTMKSNQFFLLFFACLLLSCGSKTNPDNEVVTDTLVVRDTIIQLAEVDTAKLRNDQNFEFFFEKHGVEGAFLLFDPQENRFYRHNSKRTKERFIPASTFKILNSLIALEAGVISDTNTVMKWDGKIREIGNWNQDLDMKRAFNYSAVWFYQDLARKVGEKRMQHYVNLADYGNKNIDGGIDKFWLTGKLRISMEDQIIFLRKLYREELAFSKKNQRKVKGIMEYLKTEEYTIRAKSGWATATKNGWFVGWVEKSGAIGYSFATHIDILKSEDVQARQNITIDILKSMRII